MNKCGQCACLPGGYTVEQDVDFLESHHGAANVGPFFQWADRFLTDTLVKVGRPKNSYTYGCPGSGKSTLADLVRLIVPERRSHIPCLNTGTPYSALQPSHLLSICEDWRFTSRVPVSETLQWLEGRAFLVDVKSKEPRRLDAGPPCMHSSNHKDAQKPWAAADVQAYMDRCFVSNLLTPIPAERRQEGMLGRMEACPHCCMASLAKRCPTIRAKWLSARPPQLQLENAPCVSGLVLHPGELGNTLPQPAGSGRPQGRRVHQQIRDRWSRQRRENRVKDEDTQAEQARSSHEPPAPSAFATGKRVRK